jgi:hypothetical protein
MGKNLGGLGPGLLILIFAKIPSPQLKEVEDQLCWVELGHHDCRDLAGIAISSSDCLRHALGYRVVALGKLLINQLKA